MTDNSVENNILLNYEGFLIEQAVFFEEIKRTVHEKIRSYKTNYKAYYSHDLDRNNKIAYEKALEEIEKVKTDLNKMSEFLEIFGMLTQQMVGEDMENLEMLKFQHEEVKAKLNTVKNKGSASKPLKENYKNEYRSNFLMLFLKVIFSVIIFVIAYIQIKNRKL